ncbi:ribosome-associated heat shock protein Hsp15 [Actinobaculum suis]|uniref:Heat shock protein 15 n=1 Tax=Actinobaculum suis TaxID=1657 RepID=A0A0K9EUY0_9ACTO|nr:S4 domain-containing protein [Actinobaculum suis]KMY23695.1 RNA-binding protein S4 [Actinobaculum suis]MDY5153137.1 S4 domain-containing protein [Actinobaculum suis]SDE33543.1 ribosome-associated heat shock protein Hsp15 [Actinobaculum suis]VDG76435.1 Heat shock protein 15 [Actinobaculum suis]
MDSVRVDVWLWSVRQCKTRSLATAECKAGHVRINDEPAKPASKVRVGDTVRYRVEGFDRVLRVTGLLKKRVSAPLARENYEDLTPARPRPLLPIARRDPGTGRPTKKERRELDRLFGRDANFGRRRN